MIVVLALLGITVAISAVALGSTSAPMSVDSLRAARTAAIRDGIGVTRGNVRFLPDGRAIGPGVDPLTGRANAR